MNAIVGLGFNLYFLPSQTQTNETEAQEWDKRALGMLARFPPLLIHPQQMMNLKLKGLKLRVV
jgi:hypothetical protein